MIVTFETHEVLVTARSFDQRGITRRTRTYTSCWIVDWATVGSLVAKAASVPGTLISEVIRVWGCKCIEWIWAAAGIRRISGG